ncbi:methyl-accepting chemotaxis protein [Sediminispirochaeta smaragdinae]|jgi:methyl-accepting chemotaxis protein|uniref:Methyl-accepting chemotaxis sensory transducer n=1 Tax=Sediminispirochaeta smaragdinae (strain DSM 11293 / JCM 15392 / SEBR 4228) TaxID=573413 RepID=E1R2C1_SEDSS|nr:methyl-accepting chemotaxis protein [Sediminispirochaeta smaragdinae]ADK82481.1 methyl-accepting chemotaxis sensory transducer [Sediminispirochaeta smaragdinae DSM 11293]
MKKKKTSIIVPFLALTLAILVALLMGMIQWIHVSFRNEIIRSKLTLGSTVTTDIARSIETVFKNQIVIAKMLSSQPSIVDLCQNPDNQNLYERVLKNFKNTYDTSDGYENVFIVRYGSDSITLHLDKEYSIPNGGILISSAGNKDLGAGADKDWSTEIKKGSDFYIGKPYRSLVSGAPVFVLTVPVKAEGEVIGAVGLATRLSFITDQFIKQEGFAKDEYIFMFDDRGYLLSHPEDTLVLSEKGRESIAPISEKAHNKILQFKELNGDSLNYYFGSQVNLNTSNHTVWYLFYREPEHIMMASIKKITTSSFLILFASILIISGAIVTTTRHIILNPLTTIKKELEGISKGGGDLTAKIRIDKNNEIGEIASAFNAFTDTLLEMINKIKHSVAVHSTMRDRLAASTEETSASVNQIMSNINSIKTMMDKLLHQSNEASNSTKAINDTIAGLTGLAGTQSSAVQQSTAAVEEMISALKNTAKITTRQKTMADNLMKGAEESSEVLEEAYNSIVKVNTNIDSIMEMTSVIDDISSQTNLLAMNAAIEAAHAGESGKGFAVVADEIRKLAEHSSTSSSRITLEVKTIIEQIQLSAHNFDSLKQSIDEIVKEIKSTADAFSEINTSTVEMSSGSDQILQAMASLSDTSVELTEAAENMQNQTTTVSEDIKSVLQLTQSSNLAVEEISVGSREILTAMNNITDDVQNLGETTQELSERVSNFKTEGDVV